MPQNLNQLEAAVGKGGYYNTRGSNGVNQYFDDRGNEIDQDRALQMSLHGETAPGVKGSQRVDMSDIENLRRFIQTGKSLSSLSLQEQQQIAPDIVGFNPQTGQTGSNPYAAGIVARQDQAADALTYSTTESGKPAPRKKTTQSAPAVKGAQQTQPQGTTPQGVIKDPVTGNQYVKNAQGVYVPYTGSGSAQGGGQAIQPTGSVVDTLKMAGQDSSYAARAQLAAQYGIQNYQGTAAQNIALEKKFVEAYNQLKGKEAPKNGSEARTALTSYFEDEDKALNKDPFQEFFSAYGSMSPMEAQIFDQMSQLLDSKQTTQSLRELYDKEVSKQGIPGLQIELADLNRIMEGTEDDIRDEVTQAGGFATESQVQALTGARNKVLLRKAQYLSDVIAAKNDYVKNIVSLTDADQKRVGEELDRKLGITKTLFDMTTQMQNRTRENYQNLVNSVGWGGVAQMVAGNPKQARAIESALGLSPGGIQALASYKPPMTEMEMLELENRKLQNQKLQAELVKINTAGGAKVDPATQLLGMAMQQQTIVDTDKLSSAAGLNSAVGPNALSRIAVGDAFGAKSNFIASVEQLRQQLTLDKLITAKGSGATFGALSEGELQLLAASASKLGTWAIKDKAGNVTGYNTSEASFKAEVDKINHFQKLDYILKGGNPSSVGVVQMGDGSLWVKNSDGSMTKL